MVVNLAVASIFGAALTPALLRPFISWPALLCAPFGGSALALIVGLVNASLPEQARMLSDDDIDGMVADLRGVLSDARLFEVEKPEWENSADDPSRAALDA